MKKKVYCHTCNGKGMVKESEYPSKAEIEVPCPECNGDGWVTVELGDEK